MRRIPDGPSPNRLEKWFVLLCQGCLVLFLLIFLSFLLLLLIMGLPRLDWEFIFGFQSRFPDQSGALSALTGTCELVLLVLLFACPIGIAAAFFIQEYGENSSSLALRRISRFFDLLLTSMEGLPSVVYGFLGLALFVNILSMGRSLLAAALTLASMAVPIIISNSRNALRSVSREKQETALSLGATKWQAFKAGVLPEALPGLVTGTCLAMGRVAGEAAPLLMVGAFSYMTFVPDRLLSPFAALPVDIYNWTVQAGGGEHANGSAAILLLIPILVFFNAISVIWRRYWEKQTAEDNAK